MLNGETWVGFGEAFNRVLARRGKFVDSHDRFYMIRIDHIPDEFRIITKSIYDSYTTLPPT